MDQHRGVSPDSSTMHISEHGKKSKKRKHKQNRSKTKHKKMKSSSSESNRNHKKSKKRKRSSKSSTHSDEFDEEIFDIKPLSGYVDDRKELHKEIFTLVSKKEVKALLPSSLKKLKFKDFKILCLEQLEVMSQKRLRHIIAGQEMVSSSSDESETRERQQNADNQERHAKDIDAPVDIPKIIEQGSGTPIAKKQPSKVSILEEMSLSPNQDEIDALFESVPQKSQQPLEAEQQGVCHSLTVEGGESPTQVEDPSLVMAEAELKELEFRARALKSLVIAREQQQKLEKQKENTSNETT